MTEPLTPHDKNDQSPIRLSGGYFLEKSSMGPWKMKAEGGVFIRCLDEFETELVDGALAAHSRARHFGGVDFSNPENTAARDGASYMKEASGQSGQACSARPGSGTAALDKGAPEASNALDASLSTTAPLDRELADIIHHCQRLSGKDDGHAYGIELYDNQWTAIVDALRRAPLSASVPKYIVRSGGECPQDWICNDIPDVQAALCEALYGRAEDADADEIGKYLAQVQAMEPTQRELNYTFEDGWLHIYQLRRSDDRTKTT